MKNESNLKPLSNGNSYLHYFGILGGSGNRLAIIDKHFLDGQSHGYNFFTLGKSFEIDEQAFNVANDLNAEFGLPKVLNSKNSQALLLKIQERFPEALIKKAN